jgi:hypothetical protein
VKRCWQLLVLLMILCASNAYAAKMGTVTRDDAFVYDRPEESSPTHFKLAVGDVVTISNYPTQGFYKVRTAKGVTGWLISNAVLVGEDSNQPEPRVSFNPSPKPSASPSEMAPVISTPIATPSPSPSPSAEPIKKTVTPVRRPAPVIPHYEDVPAGTSQAPVKEQSGSHAMSVKIFAGADFASFKEVNQLVGTTLFSSLSYYGAEFAYSLYDDIDILLRADDLTKTSSVETTSFKVSSFPIMLGLDYKALKWKKLTLSTAVLFGYSSNTELTETASSLPAPNVTQFSSNNFTEMFRVSVDLQVVQWMSLYGEFGYRFLKTPSVTPNESGSGSSVFQSNGSFVPIPLNLSGILGGGGLKFNF